MSTEINSINYLFNPDKLTQDLCEQIARLLDGNGISRADITAKAQQQFDVTITSNFTWAVEVSLKSRTVADKYKKNTKLHKSPNDAQLMAKKQGQHILRNSLGKIELVNNINEDPAHFFKHSTVKLNGGPAHAFITHCSQKCDHGTQVCPRCHGKGTHKAVTKKENFLGTSGNFAVKNACPQCKGRGKIDCPTCIGSGVQTHLYQVHVDASRKVNDVIDADPGVKQTIEKFLSNTSHETLLKSYLTPTVTELKDIDEKNCVVTYRSKPRATVLTLEINNQTYDITGFGKNGYCIDKPKILDDVLPVAIEKIFGISTAFNSTSKCMKLKAMPLLKYLLEHDYNSTAEEQASLLLHKQSDGLLSQDIALSIIKRLADIKKHLTPRYSLSAWLPIVVVGLLSAFYFGVTENNVNNLLVISCLHIAAVLSAGIFGSRLITQQRRKKLEQKSNVSTLEKLPAAVSAVIILTVILMPQLLSSNQRWSVYYSMQQNFHQFVPAASSGEHDISNQSSMREAQKYLVMLGYNNVTESGDYDLQTDIAMKDFQMKHGIKGDTFLDSTTMKWLTYYAVARQSYTDK